MPTIQDQINSWCDQTATWSDAELVDWFNDRIKENGARRLRKTTARLWVAIWRSFERLRSRQSVRGVFYQVESMGAATKDESGARKVGDQCLRMRRLGVLPYRWIADSTRLYRRPDTWSGLESFLEHGRRAYRRALWDTQPAYVEVLVEKLALSDLVAEVTEEYDVPLLPTRGFNSDTAVEAAARAYDDALAHGKAVYVYLLTDHDKSGLHMLPDLARRFARFGLVNGRDIHIERLALDADQIAAWQLPTRRAKSKEEHKMTRGMVCELDAIPAPQLQSMVRYAIERHIDAHELAMTRRTEALERETLNDVYVSLFGAST